MQYTVILIELNHQNVVIFVINRAGTTHDAVKSQQPGKVVRIDPPEPDQFTINLGRCYKQKKRGTLTKSSK